MDIGVVVFHIAPEDCHLALQLLMGGFQHIGLDPDGFQLPVLFPKGLTQFLGLGIEPVQIVMGLLQHEGGGSVVLLRFFGGGGELVQGVQPHGHLHPPELVLQLQVLPGLFGLDFQGLQLKLQFGHLVADAHEVVLGLRQLPLGFLLAVAVFGDARRFLKDFPAVVALDGENFVDASLADVGVALPAETCVHEQLVDVLEPGGLAVDVVFAVAAAVIPAGDHHLVGIIGKRPVGVVQGQGSLREAHGAPLLGAAEDHVLHLGAPEGFGALLAHDPENGIGNIRFAGAVGADDGGDVVAEPNQRLIREGLKALQFQRF